jgi:hypothetical protein
MDDACQSYRWLQNTEVDQRQLCIGKYDVTKRSPATCSICRAGFFNVTAELDDRTTQTACRSCVPAWIVVLASLLTTLVMVPLIAGGMNAFRAQ